MKLNVLMITYNHEKYISQAIESVLMQKTNFDFNLVIGEDHSTDKTREIVFEYARKYPGKIKVLPGDKNIGVQANVIRTFNARTGEYVALLEGDDYWTDPNKLQKQVDFLDKHRDHSMCFHQVHLKKGRSMTLSSAVRDIPNKNSFTIEDIAEKNFLDSPSVVYRNCLDKNLPSWFHESPVGDYVLHMLHAQYGKIGYLPEPMAVYRIHPGGIWSTDKLTHPKWIKVLDLLLKADFPNKVKLLLQKQRREMILAYLKILLESDHKKFIDLLKLAVAEDPSFGEEWLYEHYPEAIQRLSGAKSLKLARTLAAFTGRSRK